MSSARKSFCERIISIKSAITDFRLQDMPITPVNQSHNNSVRIIRNGLAVQCFNVFEDFIKARTNEVLLDVCSSNVPFEYLPDKFSAVAQDFRTVAGGG